MPSGSSMVRKRVQNGIETPKDQYFNTLHDLFSLISYFDLQRSLIFGGQMRSGSFEVRIKSEYQWFDT